MANILITGAAGFIGFHLTEQLLSGPHNLVGIDNLLQNHDFAIKQKRLEQLKLDQAILCSEKNSNSFPFCLHKIDLMDKEKLEKVFSENKFDVVIHLAAQTGVRQSASNAQVYIDNNVTAFNNLLECCKEYNVHHILYASSSSVYGMHDNIPSKETDKTDAPTSIYAATKKTCELLASVYSMQNNLLCVGLRFFTVYGPWCRTDMAAYIFMKALADKTPLNLFNYGNMLRDYTFVGDVCKSIVLLNEKLLTNNFKAPFNEVFNIGNRNATKLGDYLSTIETEMGIQAQYQLKPMQEGEVQSSFADTSKLEDFIGFRPDTELSKGVKQMVAWFKEHYQKLK